MKKLGLRAVAGSLAVLMVASVFAPAKVANAADMVTAAAPKTLVITADMVDDDGEIVISNENWDRIIVENEVAAKDIYFDGVEVKELVVESGSKSRVQLWEVDAAQVTVQEPEFNEISLKDILPLLADKETQQAALNMYMENKQANEAAAKLVPTIVTKEGAKVESVVARANATLDFAEGDVAVVALEASDKLDRAKVTLKNYDGDVTYKGSDKFSSMTLKNVNSTISLTVDESTDKNYFTVTGKNSLVEKAEVAGNAQVALDAPMGVVEISEKATAAQVTILDSAEEMNVASKGAKVELTMNADVALATVTADNVKVEGQGTLKEAVLEGKGAYVSTNGTKVEGENTYVKPVYVEKLEDIEYTFATLGAGGWNNTRLGSTDGGETYKLNANYGGEVIYDLPKSVDACLYNEAIIKVRTEDGNPVTVKLTAEGAAKDEWGNPVPFFSKAVTGEATVVVPLALHAGKMIDQVRFQSGGSEVTATFFDVTFKLNPNGPVDPIVPPADGTLCTPDAWKLVAFNTDFRQFAGKNVKVTVEAIRLGGPVDLAVNGQFEPEYGTGLHWGKEIGTEWTDFGIESWTVPAEWASKTAPIYYSIRNIDGVDYAQSLIYYRNFSVEVLEDDTTGDTTPTPEPEEPTPEVTFPELPENSVVYNFADLETLIVNEAEITEVENGGQKISTSGDYGQVHYTLPNAIKLGDYEKIIITASSTTAGFGVTPRTAGGWNGSSVSENAFWWSREATDITNIELKYDQLGYSWNYTLTEDDLAKEVTEICLQSCGAPTDFVVYRIALIPKESEVTPDPTPEVTVIINAILSNKLTVGDQITLTADVSVTGSALVWSSSDETVATVDKNGVVTAISAGDVTIKASCGNASDTMNLVVEAKEEVIKEFYLVQDIAFSDIVVGAENSADVGDCYLNEWTNGDMSGHNFVDKLPESLKANTVVADKFKTLTGIMEMVDYFEVEITLTEATAVEGKEGYAPQAQVYLQSSDWSKGTWGQFIGNVGEPSEGAPTSGVVQHSTSVCADWTSPTLAKLGIQMINAEAGSTLAGSYSVKVVLK